MVSEVKLPKIALGAWAWSNDGIFGNNLNPENLRPVFEKAVAHGLNLWDTAYTYGMGTSEKVLADFITGYPRESFLLSDKFTPQCANYSSKTTVKDMIEMQLKLMELDSFDIYWIHNAMDAPRWIEELAQYFENSDNVPILGVANHNLAEIKQANEILKSHGLELSAVQNHYSLLNRASEDSGILEYCHENDIIFFPYMILEYGILSGNSSLMLKGTNTAKNFDQRELEILNTELKNLAEKYQVGSEQIPVAWALSKGTLPIIGVTKTSDIEGIIRAVDITLTKEEIHFLEKLADNTKINTIHSKNK